MIIEAIKVKSPFFIAFKRFEGVFKEGECL